MSTTIPANVTATQARNLLEDRARLIDVRNPAEFESVHIPGSYNVPLDLLSEHRDELSRTVDSPVILVCGTGVRASHAEVALRQAGFDSLSVLDGGITAWMEQGHEVVRGKRKWPMERQVRGVAGGLVLTGTVGGMLFWRPLAYIAMFVGGGLFFSAITDTCGMAKVLAKLPYNQGAGCDIDKVMNQLSENNRT